MEGNVRQFSFAQHSLQAAFDKPVKVDNLVNENGLPKQSK